MPYISVTEEVDFGEGSQTVTRIVWVDGPVDPGTDTYIPRDDGESVSFVRVPPPVPAPPPPPVPAPPPPPPPAGDNVDRTPAPVPAPAPASAVTITAPPAPPGSLTQTLQQQIANLKTDAELQAFLATTTATPAQLAAASGYNAADIQAAIDRSKAEYRAPNSTAPIDPRDTTALIRDQIGRLRDNVELQAFLVTTTFTPEQLNAAYPEYSVADIKAAQVAARTDGRFDPKNPQFANMYADINVTQQFGRFQLPKPVAVDAKGNPVYAFDDPALKVAKDLIAADTKAAWDRAVREIYGQYGQRPPEVISSVINPETGRPAITLTVAGQLIVAPTDKYFEGIPQISGESLSFSQDRPVEQFATGIAGRVVEITPALRESVAVQLPSGDNIVVDPNSELARYIQYLGTSNNSLFQTQFAEIWAKNGVTNPYTDPATVAYAIKTLETIKLRQEKLAQDGGYFGVEPQESIWNDPDWPKYVGSSKQAFQEAVRALEDPAYRESLKAANNWSQADYEGWSLQILNPEESARIRAEYDRANGIVVGPSSGGGGSSRYGISTGGSTVFEQSINQYNPNGTPVTTYTPTAPNPEPQQDPLAALRDTGIDNSLLQGLLAGGLTVEAITNLINNGVDLSSLQGLIAGGADTIQNIVDGAIGSVSGAIGGINPNDVATLIRQAQGAITGALTLPAIDPIVDKIEAAGDALAGNAAQLAAAAAAGAGIVPSQLSAILRTQSQATLQARNKEAAAGDWRVRIQLAPGATYLYKDAQPGILGPLFDTDGVIFPYTPQIETSYVANYDKYDLVHSNYRGYFYKNSAVNEINVRGTFTAQDTQEANYLLAVIHFFRSVTKMFYGQDSLRGAPPPLVYLSGLGNYQFSGHPCFVASFNYSLPNDVDYIRALAPNNYGTNLITQRTRTGSISSNPFSATLDRLTATFGSNNPVNPYPPDPGILSQNVNNTSGATYVPTKMEINLTLLPTNTRAQVSQQFSLKAFANGSLLKGGFW